MTVEEIKESVSMQSVLSERGIKVVRGRMASCPFHGNDRHPSMRVYRDGYRCFTCGDCGDVIQFVMKYDGVDFKTAFLSLGGTYAKTSDKERKILKLMREDARKKKEREERAKRQFVYMLSSTMTVCRAVTELYEPFSDEWCDAMNLIQKLEHIWEESQINGEEVDKASVFGKCGKFKRRHLTFG